MHWWSLLQSKVLSIDDLVVHLLSIEFSILVLYGSLLLLLSLHSTHVLSAFSLLLLSMVLLER